MRHNIELTDEQASYIKSPINLNIYLEACPGSGKTEVIAKKAAKEISEWRNSPGGIAFLSFSNSASCELDKRITESLHPPSKIFPHNIGTFDSFILRNIVSFHAHKLTGYSPSDGDFSLKIVDSNSEIHIRTKYKYGGRGHLSACAYDYDFATKKYVASTGDRTLNGAINSLRLAEWQVTDFRNTKERLLKAGFATYRDIEQLALRILCDECMKEFCRTIAYRYPLIIIDECQDLSLEQLCIVNKLIQNGSNIHLVGDLKQSIYGFRNSQPENVEQFIKEQAFLKMTLTQNFRSTQKIVNVCSNIIGIDKISGRENISTPSCLIVQYNNNPIEVLEWFNRFTSKFTNRVIVARGHSTLSKIIGTKKTDNDTEKLANSIALFCVDDMIKLKESLRLFSEFARNRIITEPAVKINSFNCPRTIDSNVAWRDFLLRTIEYLAANGLSDLSLNWSGWSRLAKRLIKNIDKQPFINKSISSILNCSEINLISPRGKAEEAVGISVGVSRSKMNEIRIATIHEVKGETHDVTMLISSTKPSGKESHWKEWINSPNSEAARMAYVASSRPRDMIIWAVKKLKTNEIHPLRELGFDIATTAQMSNVA